MQKIRRIFPARAESFMSLGRKEMAERVIRLLDNRKVDITAESVDYDAEKKVWHFRNGTFISYDRPEELRFEASRGTSVLHTEIRFDELCFSRKSMPDTPSDVINTVKEKDDLPSVMIADLIRRNPNMPSLMSRERSTYRFSGWRTEIF